LQNEQGSRWVTFKIYVHSVVQKTIIVFQETKHKYITLIGEDLNPIFERLCSSSPTIKPPKLNNPIQAHSIAIKKDEKNPSPIEHVLLHSLLFTYTSVNPVHNTPIELPPARSFLARPPPCWSHRERAVTGGKDGWTDGRTKERKEDGQRITTTFIHQR
jgi:hypothetical protein